MNLGLRGQRGVVNPTNTSLHLKIRLGCCEGLVILKQRVGLFLRFICLMQVHDLEPTVNADAVSFRDNFTATDELAGRLYVLVGAHFTREVPV